MTNTTRNSKKRSNSSSKTGEQKSKPQTARKPPKRTHRKKRGFKRELSCGGIIYRKREGQVEFFFIRDPYGRWTFPKGHQELGETFVETAVREIDEETGLRGLHYLAPLGQTRFNFRRGKTTIQKTVHLFLFEVPPARKEQLPGIEGITEAQWFPLEKAKKISGYRNLDRLLSKAIRLAKEHTHGKKS